MHTRKAEQKLSHLDPSLSTPELLSAQVGIKHLCTEAILWNKWCNGCACVCVHLCACVKTCVCVHVCAQKHPVK
jgi:hypothetical protein